MVPSVLSCRSITDRISAFDSLATSIIESSPEPLTPAELELVNSCVRLAFKISHNAFLATVRVIPCIEPDTFQSEALLLLCKLARKQNDRKGPFGAYVTKSIKLHMRTVRKKLVNECKNIQFSQIEAAGRRVLEIVDHRYPSADPDLVAMCLHYATDRQQRLLQWRYLDGMTTRAIAEREGITKQRASQLIADAERQIREKVLVELDG